MDHGTRSIPLALSCGMRIGNEGIGGKQTGRCARFGIRRCKRAGDGTHDRYRVIREEVLEPMMQDVVGEGGDIKSDDLAAYAEEFLIKAGMTEEQISLLRERLTEKTG